MNERATTNLGDTITTIGGFFLRAWFIKLLWNGIIDDLFSVSRLSYWESVGLLFLAACFLHNDSRNQIKDRLERLVWKKQTP